MAGEHDAGLDELVELIVEQHQLVRGAFPPRNPVLRWLWETRSGCVASVVLFPVTVPILVGYMLLVVARAMRGRQVLEERCVRAYQGWAGIDRQGAECAVKDVIAELDDLAQIEPHVRESLDLLAAAPTLRVTARALLLYFRDGHRSEDALLLEVQRAYDDLQSARGEERLKRPKLLSSPRPKDNADEKRRFYEAWARWTEADVPEAAGG